MLSIQQAPTVNQAKIKYFVNPGFDTCTKGHTAVHRSIRSSNMDVKNIGDLNKRKADKSFYRPCETSFHGARC